MSSLSRTNLRNSWLIIICLALALPLVMAPVASGAASYGFEFLWGGPSTGGSIGCFNYPSSISTDAQGNVYVGDYYNKRVQKFTPTGTYMMSFASPTNVYSTAVDAAGNVFVGTGAYGSTTIRKYGPTGAFLSSFPVWSYLGQPNDTEFDRTGRLLAVGARSHGVHIFDATGTRVGVIGEDVLTFPVEIAPRADGGLFVADMLGIASFDAQGAFLGRLPAVAPSYGFKGLAASADGTTLFAAGRGLIAAYDTAGALKSKFAPAGEPRSSTTADYRDICLAPSGKLYAIQVEGSNGVKVFRPLNLPPLAEAGPDMTVRSDRSFVLDGSASRDPDGTIASAVWSFPDGGVVDGLTTETRKPAPGVYTVTLTVRDDAGAEASDSMMLTVRQPTPEERIAELRAAVEAAPIRMRGVRNSLLVKVDKANLALSRGDKAAAMRHLRAFAAEAGALTGKQLGSVAGAQWRNEAMSISVALASAR